MLLTSLLNALPGAVTQGLIWGLMAIGVYITYRILDVADLTVDGSLALGGAACVMLIRGGVNPWLALLIAALCGVAAGFITGTLHTRCGIPAGSRAALKSHCRTDQQDHHADRDQYDFCHIRSLTSSAPSSGTSPSGPGSPVPRILDRHDPVRARRLAGASSARSAVSISVTHFFSPFILNH